MNNLVMKQFFKNFQFSIAFRSLSTRAEPRVPDNSKCINKVILMGRCVGDAQLKSSSLNNSNFCSFVMATNEIRKTKTNELVKRSDFHKVFVYLPFLAQKCNNLITKGTRIYLEGKLNYRKFDDQFFSNIIAEKVIFISGANQSADSIDEFVEESEDTYINEEIPEEEVRNNQTN